MGVVPVTVPLDQYGMIPEKMREALSKWDPDAAPGTTDKPKLIYTIPTGHNPTGVTYSLERKKEIYQVSNGLCIIGDFSTLAGIPMGPTWVSHLVCTNINITGVTSYRY